MITRVTVVFSLINFVPDFMTDSMRKILASQSKHLPVKTSNQPLGTQMGSLNKTLVARIHNLGTSGDQTSVWQQP